MAGLRALRTRIKTGICTCAVVDRGSVPGDKFRRRCTAVYLESENGHPCDDAFLGALWKAAIPVGTPFRIGRCSLNFVPLPS